MPWHALITCCCGGEQVFATNLGYLNNAVLMPNLFVGDPPTDLPADSKGAPCFGGMLQPLA